jgi:methionine sulfoxide reductase heme-binding subunit
VTLAAANYTWYIARAGGIVAYLLLTASVLLGLLLSGKSNVRGWPRFAIEEVHAFAGLLAGCFIFLHAGVLLFDGYMPFSLGQLLVPGTAPYRPLEVAFGVIAAEVLVALALTNRYRSRIPYRLWRRAHYLNFAVWFLALLHGFTAGTDSMTVWALPLYTGSAWLVLALTVHRASMRWPDPASPRTS